MKRSAETTEIWNRTHNRLLSYIRSRVATMQDAEDILQEVFVRIHANLQRLKDTQSIDAWIYRIARNAITDYYRERAKAASAIKSLADEAGAEAPHGARSVAGDTREPSAVIGGCVAQLVDYLPERYREAVAMTEIGGLSQTAAAGKLGISVSGMKSRVQRGREKLKGLLLDCCHVEFDRRKGVIDYEPKRSGSCDDKCDCR